MRFRLSALWLGLILPRTGGASLLDELIECRTRLPAFCATYLETIDVTGDAPTGGGTPGWGARDSEILIEASVDSYSSSVTYPYFDKLHPERSGGVRRFVNGQDVSYQFIEAGKRGAFGSHPHGMISPTAFGYEIASEPLRCVMKRMTCVDVGNLQTKCTDAFATILINFRRFGRQLVIESTKSSSPQGRTRFARVVSWVTFNGAVFPQLIAMEPMRLEGFVQEREYELVAVLPHKSVPIGIPLIEGAILKDDDKNIVYSVKNGKLYVDPVFSQPSDDAWRRTYLIVGATLILWLIWYLLSSRLEQRFLLKVSRR